MPCGFEIEALLSPALAASLTVFISIVIYRCLMKLQHFTYSRNMFEDVIGGTAVSAIQSALNGIKNPVREKKRSRLHVWLASDFSAVESAGMRGIL